VTKGTLRVPAVMHISVLVMAPVIGTVVPVNVSWKSNKTALGEKNYD